jgi:PAS domain-containing protein
MLGIPLSQIVGHKYLDMPVPTIREDGSPFPSDEYPGIIALQTGKAVHDVIMGVLNGSDQVVRWLLVTAQPVADPDEERVIEVVTTLVDISQRVQAEKKALEERQRVEALLDLSAVGILVTDASGCLLLTNREMHRLWGLPPRSESHWMRTINQ